MLSIKFKNRLFNCTLSISAINWPKCVIKKYWQNTVLRIYSREDFEEFMPKEFTNTQEDSDIQYSIEEPKMYRVIMLNDHFTTMEFVVDVLMGIFRKSSEEATQIMLNIHQQGSGDCGVYTYDIAGTKINQVHTRARQSGYPLKCTMEEA